MHKVVVVQSLAVLAVSLIAAMWLGERGLKSAMIGGLAYIIPNLIFVVRLAVLTRSERASATTFFVGELGKVLATIAILGVAQRYCDVHWLTMLFGLFAALKSNLFAFLLKI